ncbi:MAG: hypothetical protein H7841_02550 [Magnetospirillum sp. WYHS-4]
MARFRALPGLVSVLPRRRRVGAWLTLLAVVLNLAANILYAPSLQAAGFTRVEWVEICTAHGLQAMPVQVPDESGGGAGKGYCPACPVCPVQLSAGTAPVLLVLVGILVAPTTAAIPSVQKGTGADRAPPAASCLPIRSQAPPTSV